MRGVRNLIAQIWAISTLFALYASLKFKMDVQLTEYIVRKI